jgi:hypothetical protein
MVGRGLVQVTFRFPKSAEIRFLPEPPAAGDEVSSGGRIWVVSEVREGTFWRTYTAVCVPVERRKFSAVASDLLRRVKDAREAERPRRWR